MQIFQLITSKSHQSFKEQRDLILFKISHIKEKEKNFKVYTMSTKKEKL